MISRIGNHSRRNSTQFRLVALISTLGLLTGLTNTLKDKLTVQFKKAAPSTHAAPGGTQQHAFANAQVRRFSGNSASGIGHS
jgi:hypothetical protein